MCESVMKYQDQTEAVESQLTQLLSEFGQLLDAPSDDPDWKTRFSSNCTHIQSSSQQLDTLCNSIQSDMKTLDQTMTEVSRQFQQEQDMKRKSQRILSDLTNSYHGSELSVANTKSQYNRQYVQNVQLLFGILIELNAIATVWFLAHK